MKRTIGLAAAAILLVALLAACSQKPAESTSAPAASPAPTPEPSPEPTPTAEPVEQEVADPADTAEDAEPVNETDELFDEKMDAFWEQRIQSYMDDFGMTREEAEEWVQKSKDQAAAEIAELEKQWAEHGARVQAEMEAEQKAASERADQETMERYGLTFDEWSSMSAAEQYQWSYEHQKE